MCFVDLEKAYNCVPRYWMSELLQDYGASQLLLCVNWSLEGVQSDLCLGSNLKLFVVMMVRISRCRGLVISVLLKPCVGFGGIMVSISFAQPLTRMV